MSAGRRGAAVQRGAGEGLFNCCFPRASVLRRCDRSHADIEAARINDVREFHQQFYTPNNASIAIAGDFNPAQLKALLTKYFGRFRRAKVEAVTTERCRRL